MPPQPTIASYAFDADDEEDDEIALRQQEGPMTSSSSDFKDADEVAGASEVLGALTQDEMEQLPDENMPLRHYRAEKVRKRFGASRGFPLQSIYIPLTLSFSFWILLPTTTNINISREISKRPLQKSRKPFNGEKSLASRRLPIASIQNNKRTEQQQQQPQILFLIPHKNWPKRFARKMPLLKCTCGDTIWRGAPYCTCVPRRKIRRTNWEI
jgi:hypothetical protein